MLFTDVGNIGLKTSLGVEIISFIVDTLTLRYRRVSKNRSYPEQF